MKGLTVECLQYIILYPAAKDRGHRRKGTRESTTLSDAALGGPEALEDAQTHSGCHWCDYFLPRVL